MTKRKRPSHFSFNLSTAMPNNPYSKVMKEKEKNHARTPISSPFMGSQFIVRDDMEAWTKELKVGVGSW